MPDYVAPIIKKFEDVIDHTKVVKIKIVNHFGQQIWVRCSKGDINKFNWVPIQDDKQHEFVFYGDLLGDTTCFCTVWHNRKQEDFPVYGDGALRDRHVTYEIYNYEVKENRVKKFEWGGWKLVPKGEEEPTSPQSDPSSQNVRSTIEISVTKSRQ